MLQPRKKQCTYKERLDIIARAIRMSGIHVRENSCNAWSQTQRELPNYPQYSEY